MDGYPIKCFLYIKDTPGNLIIIKGINLIRNKKQQSAVNCLNLFYESNQAKEKRSCKADTIR